MDHRLQMNTFLGKWLHYLAERGHGPRTLTPPETVPRISVFQRVGP